MGSSVTKSKQPAGFTQRKSALKNKQGATQQTGNNTNNDPFGTETFQPNRAPQTETLPTQQEIIYPSPRPEVPGDRTIPRVHYEENTDVPVNRDGMVLSDRWDRPMPSHRTWPGEEGFVDENHNDSPRRFRPHIPYSYGPRPAGRRPYHQYTYPHRSLPPSIYPYRLPEPRVCLPSNQMVRQPVPVDDRYRPVPVLYDSQRAVPVAVPISDQPPPYHAVEPLAYRQNYATLPRENPQVVQRDEVMLPNQGGGITERSGIYENQGDISNRDREVESLLSPEYLANVKISETSKSKSPVSIHERDDDDYIGANLKFYRNQMKFRPNGETIEYIHKYWYGNYTLLEKLHTYIQWLFPLYDSSRVNPEAVPLRAHEAKHISDDPDTHTRFLTSFLMMLDFYGFRMADDKIGKLEKAPNWKERFNNLRRSGHNHTRITRILKSLGELGQSKLQTPFVMALFHEVFETKELAGIPPATLHHWLRSVKDDFEREYVYKQFKKGLTRLEEERKDLKRRDSTKYYFERNKSLNEQNKQVMFMLRKKPRI